MTYLCGAMPVECRIVEAPGEMCATEARLIRKLLKGSAIIQPGFDEIEQAT
jgi:hypothetical protein